MKYSVIIPSLNQAEFLEECINSVLEEKKKHDLEIIIMDGGSIDGSINIIKKYSKYIDFWRSHPDDGQAAAIAEGINICKGDYISWLNSDDCWEKGVLDIIEEVVNKTKCQLIIGDAKIVETHGNLKWICRAKLISVRALVLLGDGFSQPSVFFSRSLYKSVGGLRKDLRCAFDHDIFLKMLLKTKPVVVHKTLSRFRLHGQNKTTKLKDILSQELQDIHRKYIYSEYPLFFKKFWQVIYRFQAGILDKYGYILHMIKLS